MREARGSTPRISTFFILFFFFFSIFLTQQLLFFNVIPNIYSLNQDQKTESCRNIPCWELRLGAGREGKCVWGAGGGGR